MRGASRQAARCLWRLASAPGSRRWTHVTAHDSARGGVFPLGHPPQPGAAAGATPPLTWYSCGPTVYDAAHLGHARTYVALDVLRRVTAAYGGGRPLLYAMGVTDIDDKILARAAERGVHPRDLSAQYEEAFWGDMAALGVLPPTAVLRVTEHIPDIIEYVAAIVSNGHGYVIPGSGVYLDVESLGGAYGTLGPEQARKAAPLASGSPCAGGGQGEHSPVEDERAVLGKRDARDFALWKASVGDPAAGTSWPSPWGWGRPGWHIECSAMTHAWCGGRMDVHAGGVDLAFPHHCNEIAQAVAFAGRHPPAGTPPTPWVGSWLHTGHLHIAGRKMSKSLKNFVTIESMLGDARPATTGAAVSAADAFRMFTCLHGYRATLSYAPERLDDARAVAHKLHAAAVQLLAFLTPRPSVDVRTPARWSDGDRRFAALVTGCATEVSSALRSDFDTPAALRSVSGLASATVGYAHTGGSTPQPALVAAALRGVLEPLVALGFDFAAGVEAGVLAHTLSSSRGAPSTSGDLRASAAFGPPPHAVLALVRLRGEVRASSSDVGAVVKALAREGGGGAGGVEAVLPRLQAAQGRLLAASDAVRDTDLPALGWRVQDTPQGGVVTPA